MNKRVKEIAVLANDVYEKTTSLNILCGKENEEDDDKSNSGRIKTIYNKSPQEIYSKIETYIDSQRLPLALAG